MRLVTKTHDYYDGVIKTSISDKSFTFVREQREEEIYGIQTIYIFYDTPKIGYNFEGGVIGFCGEIYSFVKVTETHRFVYPHCIKEFFFYDYDSLIEEYPKIADVKSSFNRLRGLLKPTDLKRWLTDGEIRFWQSSYSVKNDSKLKEFFSKNRIAYYVVQSKKRRASEHIIEIYPELKRFEFYKIFDAYTTFQKIEMYLTNELVKPDELNINPIDDKIKAQSKGFNKWSFRKMKEG